MGYPEYGGHIDEILRGTDSIAIVKNREYSYRAGRTKEDLYSQLRALDRYDKIERVYHGLDLQTVLPRLEAAITEANNLRDLNIRGRLYLRVDFTRRLTKVNA
jgi:hypothetical protein